MRMHRGFIVLFLGWRGSGRGRSQNPKPVEGIEIFLLMTFIELFAGIGGFRLGLENTGHKCVWSNEWEQKPREIYNHNFGELPDDRDIRDVCGRELPKADLLVGGFPCATFSVAGRQTGMSLEDTRGTLCFEMFRIVQQRRIPYLLFENVKGLLFNDNGRSLGIILKSLDEMGYDCQWEVLDTANFGIPQHRERIFLIGHLRGEPRPKVFPIGRKGEKDTRRSAEGVRPLLTPDRVNKRQRGRRVKNDGDPAFTIGVQDRHGILLEDKDFNYGSKRLNETLAKVEIGADEIKALDVYNQQAKDICPTLTLPHHNSLRLYDRSRIRKFTPLECERLQGLPDNWTKYLKGSDGEIRENSDSDRYERCGRCVSINVIEEMGRRLGNDWI